MIYGLVALTQAGLLVLVAAMVWRMLTLTRCEPLIATAGLVAQIANRKIGIRQSEAVQAISTLTSCGVLLACFRAGLEGAEFWQSHQYVQPESSLYSAITANALI